MRVAGGLAGPVFAQTPEARFTYEDVLRRAVALAGMPWRAEETELPPEFRGLGYDAYRDIRFRPERAIGLGPFRVQLFHRGFLFESKVVVNVVREGRAVPVAYAPNLFDYGRTALSRPPPLDLGFAGLRILYPLNRPDVHDELIVFLGASYFRMLSRGLQYGLSARGVAVGSGRDGEEFPAFREFWVHEAAPDASSITVDALLDGPSLTGAFRFVVTPGASTVAEVTATLVPRREIPELGLAPLTSMFFISENDRRYRTAFRPEVHDSEGLLVRRGDEWIWRPLRNPQEPVIQSRPLGPGDAFGLIQRDRTFSRYEDLEARYDLRPSYWVEPLEGGGDDRLELVELPTPDEFSDNIAAFVVPALPPQAGVTLRRRYRLTCLADDVGLHGLARVANTFQTDIPGRPATEPEAGRRFLVDFTGGDAGFHAGKPGDVEVAVEVEGGRTLRAFALAHPVIGGLRAIFDVAAPRGRSVDVTARLRARGRPFSETWSFVWTAPSA